MSASMSAIQVLVVEDSPFDIELLQEAFGKQTNVLWHFVGNVVEARKFLARSLPYKTAPCPDLVIVDLRLPIFHGSVLIPEIKANPALSKTRIAVLSGTELEPELQRYLSMGADEVHTKPHDFNGWERLLIKLLAKSLV